MCVCVLPPCTGNTTTTRHPAYVLYKSDRYPGGASAASGSGGGGGGAPQTTRRRPTLLPGQRSHTLLYAHTRTHLPIRPVEGFLPFIFSSLSHTPNPRIPDDDIIMRARALSVPILRVVYWYTMSAVYTPYAFWSFSPEFLICKSEAWYTGRKTAAGFDREPWENFGPAGRSATAA